ncbi:hypothetical protein VN24_25465 [Paenibacillus beijingensis]|uniref:Uncharacterized protein n=2 Tax=Paenibacillus beijingensis TaxID=1126833 RepID=A0A0D5NPW1_9BACL|nr:hypothetical protein VN24_25465 [Paenibacillus beijingensis]
MDHPFPDWHKKMDPAQNGAFSGYPGTFQRIVPESGFVPGSSIGSGSFPGISPLTVPGSVPGSFPGFAAAHGLSVQKYGPGASQPSLQADGSCINPGQPLLQQMQMTLEAQQTQLVQLQQQVDRLSRRLQEVEEKPSCTIEKLEYHFDQLKVEKLDGTLNIGMTPPGSGQLEELGQLSIPNHVQGGTGVFPSPSGPVSVSSPAAGPQTFTPQQMQSPHLLQQAMAQADNYMDQRASGVMEQMEAEFGLKLDTHHRQMVLVDIRKQLPARIQHYLQHYRNEEKGRRQDEKTDPQQIMIDQVTDCTLRDAEAAIRQYLKRIASERSGAVNGGSSQ